jgi:hypothetical protein
MLETARNSANRRRERLEERIGLWVFASTEVYAPSDRRAPANIPLLVPLGSTDSALTLRQLAASNKHLILLPSF